MLDEKIYLQRIHKFGEMIHEKRFHGSSALEASFIYDKINPIPYEEALKAVYKPVKLHEVWGDQWGCAWFKFKGKVPADYMGKEVGALINLGGEGCVWKNGSPWVGLTNKIHWNLSAGKYFVPLYDISEGNEAIDLLIEAGANGLFGRDQKQYELMQAEIVTVDRKAWKLDADIKVLHDLAKSLEENTPRRNKIIHGLNNVCNLWNDGKGIDKCLEITEVLLSKPANNSAMTVFSIGHAHLDLAWLWPIRETRRKGGRTFATALKLIEEYPDYLFGASQPQLYQWIKEDYPQLYDRIKQAVKDKRWECQGAMWVEPDMNISGGEALVRQCFYGKKFYQDEFGIDVDHLWLPDVFGYSAALPQILKKAGVDYFMTQKISWNETNVFPHHLFMWQGIDGTKILTHFLPTNDYNLANMPGQLIASEKRYAQNDVSDEFLNLYGIGDGGGGPSRLHVEMGLRQQNLEETPKFKFAFADDFFKKIGQIPEEDLPHWVGELYLELHRGTYTTQGLMKWYNRKLELTLRDVEFLAAINVEYPKNEIEQIWKDTLLNQFHDILPGSSITWVYKDAHQMSKKNLAKLEGIKTTLLNQLHPTKKECDNYIIYNSQSWNRKEVITWSDGTDQLVSIPSLGYAAVKKMAEAGDLIKADVDFMENDLLRITFDDLGRIVSILDKEEDREVLAGPANNLQLWEDKPNNWGAWDINHYYRQTIPEQPELVDRKIIHNTSLKVILKQNLKVGSSMIEQQISITKNSRLITISNHVDWKDVHKMLRVAAEPAIYSNEASFEIQYGTLKRPTHSNTSWDRAKFEVAAHRFADLSQPDYGFALLNDSKYGHFVQGNVMDLTLLRAPKDTDPEADLHEHDFTFAYYPHQGNLINSDVLRQGHNLNSPVIVQQVEMLPETKQLSYFDIDGDNVKIEVVKPAENGDGLIIRLYEYSGKSSKNRLKIHNQVEKIIEVDLLENDELIITENSQEVDLLFEPFEIRSFRIL